MTKLFKRPRRGKTKGRLSRADAAKSFGREGRAQASNLGFDHSSTIDAAQRPPSNHLARSNKATRELSSLLLPLLLFICCSCSGSGNEARGQGENTGPAELKTVSSASENEPPVLIFDHERRPAADGDAESPRARAASQELEELFENLEALVNAKKCLILLVDLEIETEGQGDRLFKELRDRADSSIFLLKRNKTTIPERLEVWCSPATKRRWSRFIRTSAKRSDIASLHIELVEEL